MNRTNLIAPCKLRSPLKWHGGKSYLARRIIALMPEHRVYVEPFAGGLNVLLNKAPSEIEVASDINPALMNFWRELQWPLFDQRVIQQVRDVPYEEWVFDRAKEARVPGGLSGEVDASTFLVVNRFSRGGLGRDFAWSDRIRGGRPGDANAWETIKAGLPAICLRIRGVKLLNEPAADVIRRFDGPGTLIYADPPYLHETRTHRNAYAHEMTRDQHIELLDTLNGCRGAVMLSGYMNDLYRDRLAGWTLHTFEMPNHSGQGKTKARRIECLWIKPGAEARP